MIVVSHTKSILAPSATLIKSVLPLLESSLGSVALSLTSSFFVSLTLLLSGSFATAIVSSRISVLSGSDVTGIS